eukprot:PhF_6_TR34705/c0_g1_i1/m.50502
MMSRTRLQLQESIHKFYKHALGLIQLVSVLFKRTLTELEFHINEITAALEDHKTARTLLVGILDTMKSTEVPKPTTTASATANVVRRMISFVNMEGVGKVLRDTDHYVACCGGWLAGLRGAVNDHTMCLEYFRNALTKLEPVAEKCSTNAKALCEIAKNIPDVTATVVNLTESRRPTKDVNFLSSFLEVCIEAVNSLLVNVNSQRGIVAMFQQKPSNADEVRSLTSWYGHTMDSFTAWKTEVKRRKDISEEVSKILLDAKARIRDLQTQHQMEREAFSMAHATYLPEDMLIELQELECEFMHVTRAMRYV